MLTAILTLLYDDKEVRHGERAVQPRLLGEVRLWSLKASGLSHSYCVAEDRGCSLGGRETQLRLRSARESRRLRRGWAVNLTLVAPLIEQLFLISSHPRRLLLPKVVGTAARTIVQLFQANVMKIPPSWNLCAPPSP